MSSSLWMDVTYAVRSFRKTPSLTVTIVVSIALGIAANTVVVSIVNELLIRELPVRDPSQLYVMEPAGRPSSSFPAYLDFRDQTDNIFEGLAAHSLLPVAANISAGGGARRVWGLLVSGNYFQVTGAPMQTGRGIVPSEDVAQGQNAVVVLGYGLWRNLGADPEIVGKHIVLSGAPYTVVGVTAAGFFGTDRGILSEFWAPLAMRTHLAQDITKTYMNRNCSWLEMTGRLRPSVSRQQAVAAANVVYARMHAQYEKDVPFEPVGLFRVGYLPILQDLLQPLMVALFIVVGLLLLIACANVANLLLARAASREHEIGVRLALGASRGRIVRQLLSESVLLAGTAAALGFLLAVPGTAVLAKVQPPLGIPIRFDFSPDFHVLGFTAVLAVLTGILFGLAPAFTGTRGTIMSAMRQGGWGGGFSRGRLMQILVGLQVALSLILLIAAGLFLRSLQSAASIDVGLKGEGALMMAVDPKGQGYSQEKMKRFFSDLQQRVEAIPGVAAIGYVDLPPLSLAVSNADFYDADSAESRRAAGDEMRVSAHYFTASGISLLAGRDFDSQRDENAAVAIINQATAQRLFGGPENPIGRHIRVGAGASAGNVYEVIGLVRNAKVETLGEGDVPCMFRYLSDFEGGFSLYGITMIARSSGDPGQLASAVQREVSNLDRELPLFNVETLYDHIDEALLLPRVSGALFGLFGSVGLVLALVGVYGVVNYSVRTRTREIGIRMALGASSFALVRSIVNQGLALVAAGLGIGLAVAFMLSRFTASQLYGVSSKDPVTFVGVPLLLFAASMAALLIPACRAARIEPMTALRDE